MTQEAPQSVSRLARQGSTVLGLALIVVLWGTLYVSLVHHRDWEVQNAEQGAAGVSRLFAQNGNSLLKELDRVVLFVRDHIEREGSKVSFDDLVKRTQLLSDLTIQLAAADEKGVLFLSSAGLPANGPPVSVFDREHFQVHLKRNTDEVFISKPVFGRVSGKWSVQVTRRISKPDGSFGGMVVGSLSPEQLSKVYSEIDAGQKYRIELVGLDGVVRASSGEGAFHLGYDFSGSKLLDNMKQAPKGILRYKALDERERMLVAYWKLGDFPLAVIVRQSEDSIHSAATQNIMAQIGPTLILTLLVMATVFWSANRQLKVERARAAQLWESETRERLKTSQLELTLANMDQGIVMVGPDRTVAVINDKAIDLLGLPAGRSFVRARYDELVDQQVSSNEFGSGDGHQELIEHMRALPDKPLVRAFEYERPCGKLIEIRTEAIPGGGFVRTVSDVTQRRRAEARIWQMASHDSLTGLANRVLFRKRLVSDLRQAGSSPIAVHTLDLDRFKHVNDTLGHPCGDKLLKLVADRLRQCTRPDDVVARLAGDEFAILQREATSTDAVAALASRIVASIGAPYEIEGQTVSVGVSIGLAIAPTHGREPDTLMKCADLAMYKAKNAGRGQFCFYDPELDREVQERRQLEADLRLAVELDQLELYYQPVIDMTSGLVTGYEALMRWHHPERGMVPPSVFIPIAEEHGLIVVMGEWAIRQACKQAVSLPDNTRIAINLSPVQLSSSTIRQTIMEALESTGLPGSRLVFEITETTLLQQSEHTMDMLRYLRQIGICIAMDDFGTGYASLSYLLSFPFDLVKIDRSFVAKLGVDGHDTDSTAVVRAMIEIANALGMKTIAEGVETEEQLARLQELGCVEAQGFLFSKPKPASEIASMVMPLLKQRGEVKAAIEVEPVVTEVSAVEPEIHAAAADEPASNPAASAA